jgi:hypothetical protein
VSTGRAASDDRHEGGDCEVRVKGHLDARWADWFGGLSLAHENDGTTVLRGWVVDQAALHGLLSKVRDLGLPLVSVTRVGPDQADVPTIEPHQVPTNSRKEQEQ